MSAWACVTLLCTLSMSARGGAERPLLDVLSERKLPTPDDIGKHNLTHLVAHIEPSDFVGALKLNYFSPFVNITYNTDFTTFFNFTMFKFSNRILQRVVKDKHAYPRGIINVTVGKNVSVSIMPVREQWRLWLQHYSLAIIIVLSALIFSSVLPCVGLIWCCTCRKRQYYGKSNRRTRRNCGTVFLMLLLIYGFAVACAVSTNMQVDMSLDKMIAQWMKSMHDIIDYVFLTSNEAQYMLVQNFNEFSEGVSSLIFSLGMRSSRRVSESAEIASVATLTRMVQQLEPIRKDLILVQQVTDYLQREADVLNTGLHQLKEQLLRTLHNCSQPRCIALLSKDKIGQLDIRVSYDKMPNVSGLVHNLTQLLDSDVKLELQDGLRVLTDMQRNVQRTVERHLRVGFGETGGFMSGLSAKVTVLLEKANQHIHMYLGRGLAVVQKIHKKFNGYRRNIGLLACIILFIIFSLYMFGLICGVFGALPHEKNTYNWLTRQMGSTSLNWGNGLVLFFGGLVLTLFAMYFAVAVAIQYFFCTPLANPRASRMFQDLDNFLDIENRLYGTRRPDPDGISLVTSIERCHYNETMFRVLDLQRVIDLSGLFWLVLGYGPERRAADGPVPPVTLPDYSKEMAVLRDSTTDKLRMLVDCGLADFDFDAIARGLDPNLRKLQLHSLAEELNETAQSLPQPLYATEARWLAAAANAMDYLASTAYSMKRASSAARSTSSSLSQGASMEGSMMRSAFSFLTSAVTMGAKFVTSILPTSVTDLLKSKAFMMKVKMQEYVLRLIHVANYELGRCGPVSRTLNASVHVVCQDVFIALNGNWMMLLFCSVMLFPMVFVAQILASQYRAVQREPRHPMKCEGYCDELIPPPLRDEDYMEEPKKCLVLTQAKN